MGLGPSSDEFDVACEGDAATLTTAAGDVVTLARNTSGFASDWPDYYGLPGENLIAGEPSPDLVTGCDGGAPVPDVIPDGIWRGNIAGFDGATVRESSALDLDLVCVYAVQATIDEKLAAFEAANPGVAAPLGPDGFIENTNDRTRTVPLADGFRLMDGTWTDGVSPDGELLAQCAVVDAAAPVDATDQSAVDSTWVEIRDGEARWAVNLCPIGD